MSEEQLPRQYTVITFDVEGSSGGGYSRHRELIRTTHRVIGEAVARSACAGGWIRQERGDGEMILAPDAVAPAWLLATFLPAIRVSLLAYNRNKARDHRLRLRAGLDCGDVLVDEQGVPEGGDPLVMAARLQPHPANREAMDAVPEAPLSTLISDAVYQRVVPHGALGLEPYQFRRLLLTIEGRERTAWLYLPGHQPPSVRGIADAPPPPEPVPAAAEAPGSRGDRYMTKISHGRYIQVGRDNTMHGPGDPR
jgi:class 3 adenylate cyclase